MPPFETTRWVVAGLGLIGVSGLLSTSSGREATKGSDGEVRFAKVINSEVVRRDKHSDAVRVAVGLTESDPAELVTVVSTSGEYVIIGCKVRLRVGSNELAVLDVPGPMVSTDDATVCLTPLSEQARALVKDALRATFRPKNTPLECEVSDVLLKK